MLNEIDKLGFSMRLRGIIEGMRLTQKGAAKALGIPVPQLSRYLNGQIPDPGKLLMIASWGGTTMEWLLTGKDFLIEIARKDPALGSSGKPMQKSGSEEVQSKVLQRAWSKVDPVSRGVLLRIMTEALDPQRSCEFRDHLNVVENLLRMDAPGLNQQTRLRKRAIVLSDVYRMCLTGLEEKDREYIGNEIERLNKKDPLRAFRDRELKGLQYSQQAKQRTRRTALEKTLDKQIRDVLEAARSKKLGAEEINDLTNRLLTIRRLFSLPDETMGDSGAKEVGRLKLMIGSDLADLHKKKFTNDSWLAFCGYMARLITESYPATLMNHPT